MRFLIPVIVMAILSSCSQSTNDQKTSKKGYKFYVGTYTDGASEGIYKYILKPNGTIDIIGLIAKSKNPSFLNLTQDKNHLIACNEVGDESGQGSVELYSIENDTLIQIGKSKSGGAYTCFVIANEQNYILAANYMGGNVGLLKIDQYGALSELLDIQQHTGKGTTSRQEAPHAHSAWFVPNSNEVIAVDLGTNELWFSELNSKTNKLVPAKQEKLAMAEGAGPRHLVFHPKEKYIFVLNELNGTISVVIKNKEGIYEIIQTTTTLPKNFNKYNKSADIQVSKDGEFIYASNRGHNSIAIFSVNKSNGELTLIGFESTRGKEPRSFALSPDDKFLLVVNQHNHNIVSFKRNAETGLLNFVSEAKAPTPVRIVFE